MPFVLFNMTQNIKGDLRYSPVLAKSKWKPLKRERLRRSLGCFAAENPRSTRFTAFLLGSSRRRLVASLNGTMLLGPVYRTYRSLRWMLPQSWSQCIISSWTSRTIKRYFSLNIIFLTSENEISIIVKVFHYFFNLFHSLFSFFLQKNYGFRRFRRFRRFRGLQPAVLVPQRHLRIFFGTVDQLILFGIMFRSGPPKSLIWPTWTLPPFRQLFVSA